MKWFSLNKAQVNQWNFVNLSNCWFFSLFKNNVLAFHLPTADVPGEWQLSEACTPNALNESIPIVKLKPPLFSTVVTLAPHHIPGFVAKRSHRQLCWKLLGSLALLMMHSSQSKAETKMEFPGKTYIVSCACTFWCFFMTYSKSILPDTVARSLGQCVVPTSTVCMCLQRLLLDLYVMILGQTRLHRLSISFGTYIQRHNFARFLLGKRDWLWILFLLPPMSREH